MLRKCYYHPDKAVETLIGSESSLPNALKAKLPSEEWLLLLQCEETVSVNVLKRIEKNQIE